MIYHIDGFPDRELDVDGKKYLYFGGTSYLGLQSDKEFQNTLIRTIRKYGTNLGTSRNSNVRFPVFDKAEALLATIVGSEAALTLSSGYLAGQLVAQYFNTPKHKLYYAPNTHSALYSGRRDVYADLGQLNDAIRSQLIKNKEITPVVFLDSLDFKACQYPSYDGLKSLPLNQSILIVDDSHGIGIIGKNGEGAFSKLKEFNPKELIVCCSLGKSYGLAAGTVLGEAIRIEKLRKTAFFGGASPPAPSNIATFLESQSLYNRKREILRKNIQLFKDQNPFLSYFGTLPDHPAFSFQDPHLTSYLDKKGFVLTSFNYPDETSSTMSRIVISSHHTEGDIKLLAKAIGAYYTE